MHMGQSMKKITYGKDATVLTLAVRPLYKQTLANRTITNALSYVSPGEGVWDSFFFKRSLSVHSLRYFFISIPFLGARSTLKADPSPFYTRFPHTTRDTAHQASDPPIPQPSFNLEMLQYPRALTPTDQGGQPPGPQGSPSSLTWMVMSKGVTPSPSGSNMPSDASTKKMRLSRPKNL